MSAFGIFHTAVSVLAIVFGVWALIRDRTIDPRNRVGKLYLATMLVGTLTAFGFIPSKGFTPGQLLTIITLLLLLVGTLTLRGTWRSAGYVQTISLTASFLLLMVFTTTETLTRLPVGQPFASGPEAPELLPVRLGLLVAFLGGVAYQVSKMQASRKAIAIRDVPAVRPQGTHV